MVPITEGLGTRFAVIVDKGARHPMPISDNLIRAFAIHQKQFDFFVPAEGRSEYVRTDVQA